MRRLLCVLVLGVLCSGQALAAVSWKAQWLEYRARFITPDGRVVDNGNGGVSHTEGQGYGMLLAVAAGDRRTFAKLWNWTDTHLAIRKDGLFAWRWLPHSIPHVPDHNNATDGDLLIAWALGRASERFHKPSYAARAKAIAMAIRRHLVRRTAFGPLLLPGAEGFESAKGIVVNPSYLIFPAFTALQRWDPSPLWGRLRVSGRALLRALSDSYGGLIPDWVLIKGNSLRPPPSRPLRFGYGALRVPLYCYWGGDDDVLNLAKFASVWKQKTAPAWVSLNSTAHAKRHLSGAHLAVRRLVDRILGKRNTPPAPRRLPKKYYGATITLLAELAWNERHE